MEKPVIFLFEDEIEMKEMLEDALKTEGFQVVSAVTYQEAEECINNFRVNDIPSLALLDIKQSVMSGIPEGVDPDKAGFHIAELIRRSILATIPIIFHTGYPEEYQHEARKYANGPCAFMSKGMAGQDIFSERLRSTIQKMMAEHRLKDWSKLPVGKICLKSVVRVEETGRDETVVNIHAIDDILFLEGEGGQMTKVYVQGVEKPYTLTMSPSFFMEQLQQIQYTHLLPNHLEEVYRGKFARLDRIVAFTKDTAFFDYKYARSVRITSAIYTRLQEKFPAILMY